jgi:RES domain-containing protein
LILYRVTGSKHLNRWQDAFSGEGSYRAGGRWSSVGTRMVYASTALSLATLEVLVHCNKQSFLNARVMVRFELEDDRIEQLPESELPETWNSIPESVGTQKIGDAWTKQGTAIGLIVPSATLPTLRVEERNVLLNPNLPGMLEHLQNVTMQPFSTDSRLANLLG